MYMVFKLATPLDQRNKELEALNAQDYEKAKMEGLLQLAAKWEREDL